MIDISELLNNIPSFLSVVAAIAGVIAFLVALMVPPKGIVQICTFSTTYMAGAIGMVSILGKIITIGA